MADPHKPNGEQQGGQGGPRLRGSRVLCVSQGNLLVVEHQDPATGERYWVLPGGGRERGETFEQTAVREVLEETGVKIRLMCRLRVPAPAVRTNALFLAQPVAHTLAAPTVDLAAERYLRGAAWCPVDQSHPLGELNPDFWGYLAPLIAWLASGARDCPDREVQNLLPPECLRMLRQGN